MSNEFMNSNQGHWLLSKIGKRVLRPGGRELTMKLLQRLNISMTDDVVEFAPGVGFTATQVLKYHPRSYTGIEINEEAARNLRKKIKGNCCSILTENASDTHLKDGFADKLYGEAMLTMQGNHRKAAIISEACRVLKKGGLYAVHELCLTPDDLPHETKEAIQRDLAKTLKVNARPLTKTEWIQLIEKEGFCVKQLFFSPMRLLEIKRVIVDEGFFRTMRIGFNVTRQPRTYRRIRAMRALFKKYRNELKAIAVIAEKV